MTEAINKIIFEELIKPYPLFREKAGSPFIGNRVMDIDFFMGDIIIAAYYKLLSCLLQIV